MPWNNILMKYILFSFFLVAAISVDLFCEDVWVGVYTNKDDGKKPAYWLGTIDKVEFESICSGQREKGFFQLKNVCYWESKEEGEKTKWFVEVQKDSVELGRLMFRVDKLDSIVMLDGDPTKKIIYRDKDGNLLNGENW